MTDTTDMPVQVSASPVPAELATAARYLLVMAGGWFVNEGILTRGELEAIVGALLIIAPTVWGVWKTRSNHTKQITMAAVLPDSVAQVK